MNLRNALVTPQYTKLARERQQILVAITSTKDELATARASVEQRRAELGEAEADAALQTLTDRAVLARTRTALREANESTEHLEARLSALTAKLRTANLGLLELGPAIEAERAQLVEKRLARWREEYRKAAKVFHQVILVGQALGSIGNLACFLEEANAPDPERSSENLLRTGTVRRPGAVDRHDVEYTWEQDEVALREHRSLKSETTELDDALAVIKQLRSEGAAK